jgi:hypothetical protein
MVLTVKVQGLTVMGPMVAKGDGDVKVVLATVKIQEPKVVAPVAVFVPLVMENAGTALVNATLVPSIVLLPVSEKPAGNENSIGAAPAAGTTAAKTALEAVAVKLVLATNVGATPPPPPPPPQAPSAPSKAKDSAHLVDVA